MTSSEAFVETLVAHDTKHIFGIVGSAFMDALDIFEPAGIRFVSVQHEQNAVNPQSYKDIVPYFSYFTKAFFGQIMQYIVILLFLDTL